ncbi:hypothetical protein Tco_0823020 [Tanacetum coccineum]|uniref:Uncharacterized protein n=1 Tax=Tanacetum coccineum TaxID=301880 RepID=A0ABQ5AGQ0_9ASTR
MYPTSHGTLHCQVSDLQQGGSSDHELQKQRASHWKQPAASVSNLSCLWRERTLRKPVPKSKQQCPRKSILAEGQERSPRPEHSHSYPSIMLELSVMRKSSTSPSKIVQLILFIVDSGCTKHMTGNLKLLCNSVEKFLGTAPFLNVQKTFDRSRSSLGLHGDDVCSHQFRPLKVQSWSSKVILSKQDSYITTRVGITIPPSHSNAEDNRINPMIQPEPEDLQGNSKVINSISLGVEESNKTCMDKGTKRKKPLHTTKQKQGQYIPCQNHKLIADIENDIIDPVMQCTTLPSHSGFSQQKLVSFVTEIHTLSIDISFRDR